MRTGRWCGLNIDMFVNIVIQISSQASRGVKETVFDRCWSHGSHLKTKSKFWPDFGRLQVLLFQARALPALLVEGPAPALRSGDGGGS